MSVRNGDLPGGSGIPGHGTDRDSRLVAGSIGLALFLGIGAFLVTDQLNGGGPAANRGPGALAPLVPVTPSLPAAGRDGLGPAPALTATRAGAAAPRSARPTRAPARTSVPAAAPETAGDARQLQRALSDPGSHDGSSAGPRSMATSTLDTAEGSIRVTTAGTDLTGQGDLRLAADDGAPAGDARCTHRLRTGTAGARDVPGMVLCWRTSAKRSVITLAVADSGRPSTAASLAVLDREWAALE